MVVGGLVWVQGTFEGLCAMSDTSVEHGTDSLFLVFDDGHDAVEVPFFIDACFEAWGHQEHRHGGQQECWAQDGQGP
ncbi:MAG: hypothetical protein DWI26_03395 [Planctomycetota bacterium]|nr:MAG: hypothetical protein DWI26_03395 [Planctomycetota bacterium]